VGLCGERSKSQLALLLLKKKAIVAARAIHASPTFVACEAKARSTIAAVQHHQRFLEAKAYVDPFLDPALQRITSSSYYGYVPLPSPLTRVVRFVVHALRCLIARLKKIGHLRSSRKQLEICHSVWLSISLRVTAFSDVVVLARSRRVQQGQGAGAVRAEGERCVDMGCGGRRVAESIKPLIAELQAELQVVPAALVVFTSTDPCDDQPEPETPTPETPPSVLVGPQVDTTPDSTSSDPEE
jgi:hypothetical protein